MKKLIVIGVGVLVLLGGGGGGAWWWLHHAQGAQPAEGEEKKAETAIDPSDTGVLGLDPFLVNLADKDSPRFLRATLKLVVGPKKQAVELNEDDVAKARIRSSVLELLTEQTADKVVTPEGKAALKKTIVERASKILSEGKVTDVLFSEFVVQF
jgi:flagellar protein FliL